MRSRPVRLLLASVLLVVGIGLVVWWGPQKLLVAMASSDWPQTTAQIEQVTVTDSHSRRSGRSWNANVRYRYRVGETDYTNDAWNAYGDASSKSEFEIRELAKTHAAGTEVPVYYDPDNPATSVLRRGGAGRIWANIGMGALVAVLGLVFLVRELARRG